MQLKLLLKGFHPILDLERNPHVGGHVKILRDGRTVLLLLLLLLWVTSPQDMTLSLNRRAQVSQHDKQHTTLFFLEDKGGRLALPSPILSAIPTLEAMSRSEGMAVQLLPQACAYENQKVVGEADEDHS